MTKSAHGFTLFELLIVMALVGLTIAPLLFGVKQIGQLQSLRTSSSVLEDDLNEARSSSRDGREQKAWGVVSTSLNSYAFVSGTSSNFIAQRARTLESGVRFKAAFSVWFGLGTGNPAQQASIFLTNELDQNYQVMVNEAGLVTEKQI